MSHKLYWSDEIDEEHVYTRKRMLAEMEESGIEELKVFTVKPTKVPGIFYCKDVCEFCSTDDNPCGKLNCDSYAPRNGKNGRCRYHDPYSHEPTDEFIILKLPTNNEENKFIHDFLKYEVKSKP